MSDVTQILNAIEEVLVLSAHCYPCRNPEFLFELEDYRAQGAVFWPDVNAPDTRLQWPAFGLATPRRPGSVDSDQFLIHKGLSWQPLNLACFYHDHFDYYYRYCQADKQAAQDRRATRRAAFNSSPERWAASANVPC